MYKAFNGDARLVGAFEAQAEVISETQSVVVGNVEATDALQDATVLTLSPNTTFNNERVLRLGPGITATDDGTYLTLSVNDMVPHVAGGFRLGLTVEADTTLVMPLAGVLSTQDGEETLSRKTLTSPLIAGLLDYADDAAAAAGGVPVEGLYRTGSALKIRVA
jgi:hypothetical protein